MNLEKRVADLLLEVKNYDTLDDNDKLKKFDEITGEINKIKQFITTIKSGLDDTSENNLEICLNNLEDKFMENSIKIISDINKKIEDNLSLDELLNYYNTLQEISKKYKMYINSKKMEISIS